ncbi:glycosyltransferase [Phragmitibacter flavus]|uniref:Glycosyltransferase n=1 Tax=Phragmitibacter flavus TaxID=2576071 RepID=A0A5R8K7W7_9BACT|nr:glycosyltransferase [Phragmitibacter flavus]TLD68423.1 glycosyltransferase [Phragmitibacter flavus]
MIAPQLPPAVCGIGDYTTRLVAAWPGDEKFCFLLARGVEESRAVFPGQVVEGFELSGDGLEAALDRVGASLVMMQYSGFGFDRRGCPLWMPDAFERWQAKGRGRRLAIMFHELWSLRPWWDPRVLRMRAHRHSVRRLVALSESVFTNTEGYAGWLRQFGLKTPVTVAPVGSNVSVSSSASSGKVRERGVMVVFGKQGTRLMSLRPMLAGLQRLSEAGRLKKLVILGGSDDGGRAERELLKEVLPLEQVEATGFVEEGELSAILDGAEFGISGQDWSSVEKSTTFMAYAAHGLNILSPFAGSDTRAPFAWLTGVEELLAEDGDLDGRLIERSQALRDWHASTASWPAIAAKMSEGLRPGHRVPAVAS